MKVIDVIINFSEPFRDKTIFGVLDECIESAQNLSYATINVNWFVELKYKIEEEFKLYAKEHFVAEKWLMNNHRVEKNRFRIKNNKSFPGFYNIGNLFSKRIQPKLFNNKKEFLLKRWKENYI